MRHEEMEDSDVPSNSYFYLENVILSGCFTRLALVLWLQKPERHHIYL